MTRQADVDLPELRDWSNAVVVNQAERDASLREALSELRKGGVTRLGHKTGDMVVYVWYDAECDEIHLEDLKILRTGIIYDAGLRVAEQAPALREPSEAAISAAVYAAGRRGVDWGDSPGAGAVLREMLRAAYAIDGAPTSSVDTSSGGSEFDLVDGLIKAARTYEAGGCHVKDETQLLAIRKRLLDHLRAKSGGSESSAALPQYHEVRLDGIGAIDDVALMCDSVHFERLDKNDWWLACYRGERRTTFGFTLRRTGIECTLTENDTNAKVVPAAGGSIPDRTGEPMTTALSSLVAELREGIGMLSEALMDREQRPLEGYTHTAVRDARARVDALLARLEAGKGE